MNKEELIGKEFKWISPLTGGETFGIIKKIIKDKYVNYIRIESTVGNVYPIRECTVKINNEFIDIRIDE